MAIYFQKGSTQGTQASIYADSASDVEDLQKFAEWNNLKGGSSCFVIATGDVYMLDSELEWHKQ